VNEGSRKSIEYQDFNSEDLKNKEVNRSSTFTFKKINRRLTKANIQVIDRIMKRRTRLLDVKHKLDCECDEHMSKYGH